MTYREMLKEIQEKIKSNPRMLDQTATVSILQEHGDRYYATIEPLNGIVPCKENLILSVVIV